MLVLFWPKSSAMCRNMRGGVMRSSSGAKARVFSGLEILKLLRAWSVETELRPRDARMDVARLTRH
jgi:hypothetical protein